MERSRQTGCTVRVTNIPRNMDLGVLRTDLEAYGPLENWETPAGPVHVYATFCEKAHASAAVQGLREHLRLVVDFACLDHL